MALIPEEEQLIAAQTVATNLLDVVGNGIDFPFHFTTGGQVGTIAQSNAGERVRDAIHVILTTRIGERFFNPEFGSRLYELIFEPNDNILKRLLVFYTAEALERWEKRIQITRITLLDDYNDDRSTIGISIEYYIRNSHIKGSYVFPFVREGQGTSEFYTGSESRRMLNPGAVVE
jgi:phage baseplate assembly protein W